MNNIIYKKLNPFDISFLYKDTLYIDEFVKSYPNLELEILKHELKHVDSSNSIIEDYVHDVKGGFFNNNKIIMKHKPFYFLLSSFMFLRRMNGDISVDFSRFINLIILFIFSIFLYYSL